MRETETSMIARIKSKVKWDEWQEQVNSQITSGLTVKEWCRQNSIRESLKTPVQTNGNMVK